MAQPANTYPQGFRDNEGNTWFTPERIAKIKADEKRNFTARYPKIKTPRSNYGYTSMPLYKAPGVSTGGLPEYDILREKAEQRARSKTQEATSAVDRRFAALGGLQSGAAIKTGEKVRSAVEREASERLGQIDVAEAAEKRRMEELGEAKEFQSAEAEKQRSFQHQMSTNELRQNRGLKMTALQIAQDELRLNAEIAEFNKGISQAELNKPSGLFSWLFG